LSLSLEHVIQKPVSPVNQDQELLLQPRKIFEIHRLRILPVFFLWLYNVHLQISPRERRLTIVEKTSETEDFRAKIGHVALKFIAVPGLIFLTRPVAAVTGVGIVSNTGLVVKYGWSEFIVSPVVHGVPLIWNEQTTDVAVGYMAKYLQEMVLKDNPDLDQSHFPLKYAEDILARLGYSNDISEERNQKQNESILDLDVDGTKVIKCKRKHINDAVDTLWQRYAEDTRISTLILEALLESPIDARRALAGNIILSGGMAKMPGLQRRLLQEIKNQLLEERYEKLENLDYRLTVLPCPPNCMSWLGASIYSCGESAWRNQIDSKTEEFDLEKLPDWHSNPLPEPKQLPARQSISARQSLSTDSPISKMLRISRMSPKY